MSTQNPTRHSFLLSASAGIAGLALASSPARAAAERSAHGHAATPMATTPLPLQQLRDGKWRT